MYKRQVLVTGLGPVGLAALMLAKAMGANKLIGIEMNDYRINLAKKLGLAEDVYKRQLRDSGINGYTAAYSWNRPRYILKLFYCCYCLRQR